MNYDSYTLLSRLSSTPFKNHAMYRNSDTRCISDFFSNFSLIKILVGVLLKTPTRIHILYSSIVLWNNLQIKHVYLFIQLSYNILKLGNHTSVLHKLNICICVCLKLSNTRQELRVHDYYY